jgi:hypothetical protein
MRGGRTQEGEHMATLTDEQVRRMDFRGKDIVLVKPSQVRFVWVNSIAAHLKLQIALGTDVTVMARGEDAKNILYALRESGCVTNDDLRRTAVIKRGEKP